MLRREGVTDAGLTAIASTMLTGLPGLTPDTNKSREDDMVHEARKITCLQFETIAENNRGITIVNYGNHDLGWFTRTFDAAGEVSQQGTVCVINCTKVDCLIFASATSESQLAMRIC
jgi:hypothetical protein